MPEFTAKDVQKLRQASGAGMMDAKRALDESAGDFDVALQSLREKGIAKADSRSDRESAEGAIAVAQSETAVAIVELKSETDFSAKASDFPFINSGTCRFSSRRGRKCRGNQRG